MIPGRSIALQTKLCNDIANWQPDALATSVLNQIADLPVKYPKMIPRSGSIATYNCHGYTFASRRTWIEAVSEIQKILSEDGYREIPSNQMLAGDVIIYFDSDGDAEHSGFVVVPAREPMGIPTVCSKWGGYAEVIHAANYGPYNSGRWKFYRIA